MSRNIALVLASIYLVAASPLAAQRSKPDPKADEAAIRAAVANAIEAHKTGDADRWARSVANDVVLMLEGSAAVKGIDSARAFVRGFFAMNKSELEPRIVDVQISGDLGIVQTEDRGRFVPKAGGAPMPVNMKELIAFRRQPDGAWKASFISVSNNPGPNALQAGQPAEVATLVYGAADKAAWSTADSASGIKAAPLFGDANAEAPHGEFIAFPPGVDAGTHVHTNTVNLVVLNGAYLYRDENGEKRVGPGEFIRIPGGHKHWSGGDAKDGAVFYMHMQASMDQKPAK